MRPSGNLLKQSVIMTVDKLEPLLEVLMGFGFNLSQLKIMLRVRSVHKASMSDVAQCVGHSTAAATGSVDFLERRGLVERYKELSDRRKVMVRLTPKGESTVSKLDQKLRTLS